MLSEGAASEHWPVTDHHHHHWHSWLMCSFAWQSAGGSAAAAAGLHGTLALYWTCTAKKKEVAFKTGPTSHD